MSIIDKYSKEELTSIVNSCSSYRELMRKLGYTSTGDNLKTIRVRLEKFNISTSHFTNLPKCHIKRTYENVFCKNSTVSQKILRDWYKRGNYTEYRCAICGLLPVWCGKELSLTLDHINGNNNDNRLENLRWVCPNCDRQLPTFAGKNIVSRKNVNKCKKCGKEITKGSVYCRKCYSNSRRVVERPNPIQLKEDISNLGFTNTGKKYGVSYNTIKKWCKSYNMPYKIYDYK